MDDLPGPLRDLATSLTDSGYVLANSPRSASSDDRLLRFVNGDMSVRLARAQGEWFIDLSCRAWGGGWYDAGLVRAALEHLPASEESPLATQVAWVETNLDHRLSEARGADTLRSQLERLTETQALRRFGV